MASISSGPSEAGLDGSFLHVDRKYLPAARSKREGSGEYLQDASGGAMAITLRDLLNLVSETARLVIHALST